MKTPPHVTTDATLVSDLRRSIAAQGVCPPDPTFGEFITAVYAHGVKLTDRLGSISFHNTSRDLIVERDGVDGDGRVHIAEER